MRCYIAIPRKTQHRRAIEPGGGAYVLIWRD